MLTQWTQGACTVVQASFLGEISCQIDANTLILVDIDDTLICYPSHLGNERWFIEQWAQGDPEQFHQLAGLLAENLATVPVEEGAPEIVRTWQELGARVIAITSRSMEHPAVDDWRGVTLQQVQTAGFDIGDSALVFVADVPKGEAIAALLETLPVMPMRILFIDDRLSDVEGVEAVLGDQIELLSVWYRACEPRRAAYDSSLAADELCILQNTQLFAGGTIIDQGE